MSKCGKEVGVQLKPVVGRRPKPRRFPTSTYAKRISAAQAVVDTLKDARKGDLTHVPSELGEGLDFMEKAIHTLGDERGDPLQREREARENLSHAQTRLRHGLATLIYYGRLGVIGDLATDCITPRHTP